MRARLRAALAAAFPYLLLPVCWLPAILAGGEAEMPPLWFFIPVLLVAGRGRLVPTLAVAVAGGLLGGPLTPHDIAEGTAQPTTQWVVRMLFFALAGVTVVGVVGRLHRSAMHDALTGLPNRALLAEHLGAALSRARRSGGALALLYVDLDDFKLVNDHLGHAAGDDLLTEVSRRLRGATRATDVLARQGGDEFLLLLSDLDDIEAARAATTAAFGRIREAFDAPFVLGGAELQIGVSAGVSIFPEDAPDAETLHRHADAAMYRAKAAGGGLSTYEPDATVPLARLSLAARLRRAIDDGELELHHQPVCDLRTGQVNGIESLVRWNHPRRGMVPPDQFIGVAEQTGLIDALGDWVVAETCRQGAVWAELGLSPVLAVNVSPRQLRRPDFAERLVEQLSHHGVQPRRFVLELTESAWTLEAARTLPVLEELQAAGFILALDDFGAGYSSLSRLLELPFDIVKVDRTFMAGVPDRTDAVAVLTAISQLAAACASDVVVEGVETDAQREALLDMGLRLGQGFGLGRPVPGGAATAVLLERLRDDRRIRPAADRMHG